METALVFFLVAVTLVGASLSAVLLADYGAWAILVGVPVGASIGAALAGATVAWQAGRQIDEACDPRYVRSSVSEGLRSLFAGALNQPLPDELTKLAEKLLSRRRDHGASSWRA